MGREGIMLSFDRASLGLEKTFKKQRVIMHSAGTDFDPGKAAIC
jgi:hypothetical protein